LRAAEREVRRIVAELQRGPTPERASAARGAIREALALGQVPEAPVARLRRDVLVGDHVRVPRAGITGEVLAVREGTVEIRAGTMTLRIGCDEVELLESAGKFQQRSPRVRARGPEGGHAEALEEVLRVPGNTLDLRGVRVEEGLAKLDAFLDDCMLRSVEAVFVLHGHGTGALKGAVRSALAASPYVAASAPASEEQGGDAFTVARLRD
jgi:DNA mismatch repair protein MutS2